MADLFRKKSLERLSSPDQLDLLVQVTTPRGWIALFALGALVVMALIWGVCGSLPSKVAGQGLFIRSGGLSEILSPSSGQIKDIYFSTGDFVERGYPIARIKQPELLANIKQLRALLKDLKSKYSSISTAEQLEVAMEETSAENRRVALEKKIEDLQKQFAWIKQRIENQKKLFASGLVARQTLLDSHSRNDSIQQQIRENRNALEQLTIQLRQRSNRKDQQLDGIVREISAKERELDRRILDMNDASKVLSPYFGRIIELNASCGDVVRKGVPIAKIEAVGKSTKSLEAILYVPALQGKKIKPGMRVQLSPSTVKKEEYGFILGLVTRVSNFPVSTSSMMSLLHNEALVKTLSRAGTPIEIRADLIPDPHTISGYKWSSGQGPNLNIETGTFCTSTVVVDEQRPISMVIPIFKKYLFGH